MRILIVDEHAEDRTRTIHLLNETLPAIDLVEAADRGACEQALAAGSFDLVLTDHVLSWTDGLTLLGQVQTQLPGVPVIMVTGAGDERLAVRGMKAGLADYVPKQHLDQLPDAISALPAPTDALLLDEQILDQLITPVAYYDRHLICRYCNPLAARHLGWPVAELVGRALHEIMPEQVGIWATMRGVLANGQACEQIVTLPGNGRQSRAEHAYRITFTPHRNAKGHIVGCLTQVEPTPDLMRDINDLRDAGAVREQLLAKMEQQAGELDAVLESIADAVIVYGPSGEIRRMNAAAQHMVAYHEGERAGRLRPRTAYWEVQDDAGNLSGTDPIPVVRALRGETVRAELISIERGPQKAPAWVTMSAAPIRTTTGALRGAVATITDVTPLLLAQHQLEDANAMLEEQTVELEEQTEEIQIQNEELREFSLRVDAERVRLQAVLDALPVAVFITDGEGSLLEMNDHARTIWGLNQDQSTCADLYAGRKGWWSATGEPVKADEWAVKRALRRGEVSTAERIDIERFDGGRATILNSAAPIYTPRGEIVGAVNVCQDITEHRRMERQLRQQRELLQAIYDTVPVMFAMYDPEIQSIALNKQFEQITGWTEADTVGASIMELAYPDPDYRAEVADYMKSLQPGYKDIRMVTKDGRVIETSWANIAMHDGRQVGIGLDITQRKRNEAALAEYAAELELLNHTNQMLLREVNHRVKNNLTAILGLVYAERRRLSPEKIPHAGPILDDLAQRVGSLATVHTLLSASGWRPLQLDTLAGQVIEAATPVAEGVQRLVVDVHPSSVRVTPQQAHNVALVIGELVTNSAKYGCCDGELRISLHSEVDDGHVHLVYRDGGSGYPAEVLAGEGGSVGLGLLHSIVDISLRGTWSLQNDGGAVTTIRFPLGSD